MADNKNKRKNTAGTKKLSLLVTVVDRKKAEFYMDLIQNYEVNMQLFMAARGTATTETLHFLGLSETEKAVILSVVREDRVKEILSVLDEKFSQIKGGKGIAYTIPMTGTIGVAMYAFLINNKNTVAGR